MKLRMYYSVLVTLYLMHTSAQESPPLPSVNKELTEHYGLALDAVFGMGIRLQAFLQQDEHNENFLVSPISAAVVIGQLILGAEGQFRKQLVELLSLPNSHLYENDTMHYYGKNKNVSYSLPFCTLHLQLSGLLKTLESQAGAKKEFILKQKSAVFGSNRIQWKDEFEQHLRNFYEARLHKLNFVDNPVQVQKRVNNWVSRNTNGLIKSILSEPPSPVTTSIFANAAYFKAEWQVPFSDELSRKGLFNVSATKQVDVTYMIGFIEQIAYAESADYRVIALPYKNEELGMYILLPKPDNAFKFDIKRFVQNIKSNEVLETISKARRRDVVVKIPKMTLSNTFSILDQLKKYRTFKKQEVKMRITSRVNAVDNLENKVDAFANFTTDDNMDIYLTNAALQKNLRVDDIVQQVVITVNEKGTEAAVVTASTIDYMGGSKNFILDRPFVFFIRHEATSATLFWGTIGNPAP